MDVKNNIGNGEAKELICMTHGHELRWWALLDGRGPGCSVLKWNNWNTCNEIINKIYVKKIKTCCRIW